VNVLFSSVSDFQLIYRSKQKPHFSPGIWLLVLSMPQHTVADIRHREKYVMFSGK
jgi:hypothetical protein